MSKTRIRVAAATALIIMSGGAVAQGQNQGFQEFRKGILGNYKEFRNTLLENYADFLNGEWHEYESLNGEKRYKTPKPDLAPSVEPSTNPQPGNRKKEPAVTERPAIPQPAPPTSGAAPHGPEKGKSEITFYQIPLQVPKVDYNIMQSLETTHDYARQWKLLAEGGVAAGVVPVLTAIADEMGLNDYLRFHLVKAYAESLFPGKEDSSRFSLIHYLLANMGYNVRIATTADGIPLLLLPFDRMVYGRSYMLVDNDKYYLYGPDSVDIGKLISKRILTCKLPENMDHGRKFDLILGELNIPYSPYKFELKGGNLTLSGEMNQNLIPILYHYPQMGVEGFAASELEPGLRQKLVKQLKDQVEGMEEEEAVNSLLSFTQKAFEYATDEDFHGFEKPYFLEETLYYPKNDCEDRAIFYTYMLWNVLGKEAQLISYPGHEAATVATDTPIEGTAYEFEGKQFYISDPTYIGSRTGMVMPQYKREKPTIDYTYKK
ncbi:MAG: hypothetical protein J1F07_07490 [Muribaculaceae bacterium]|nr:hypothetical protein [Muribaculaceae bacterium]